MTNPDNQQKRAAPSKKGALLPDQALSKPSSEAFSEMDILIYSALLPDHARAFWNACGKVIDSRHKNLSSIFSMAASDERTLRLCCRAFRRLFTSPRGERVFPEQFSNAKSLMLAILDFPNKSAAWRDARLSSLIPAIEILSARDIAVLFGLAAARDLYSSCKMIASCLPSSTMSAAPSATRAFYCGDLSVRAAERRRLASLRAGSSDSAPSRKTSLPTDPFFWTGALEALDGKTHPSRAHEWPAMAVEFIKAGIPRSFLFETQSPGLLKMALAAGKTATPLFYSSERTRVLSEALFLASDAMAENISQYDALTATSTEPQLNAKGQHFPQLPAEAIALLAGRSPRSEKLAELGSTKFLLASKVVRDIQEFHASGGSCEASFARMFEQKATPRAYTMDTLASAMGIALPSIVVESGSPRPPAKPSANARRAP